MSTRLLALAALLSVTIAVGYIIVSHLAPEHVALAPEFRGIISTKGTP